MFDVVASADRFSRSLLAEADYRTETSAVRACIRCEVELFVMLRPSYPETGLATSAAPG